jgi:hypothetical protein
MKFRQHVRKFSSQYHRIFHRLSTLTVENTPPSQQGEQRLTHSQQTSSLITKRHLAPFTTKRHLVTTNAISSQQTPSRHNKRHLDLQQNVISTEADHSLIVSRVVERPLYFAFGPPHKKIVENRDAFSDAAKATFSLHVHHAFHHKPTTKTPQLRTAFSKTPLKNTP